MYAFIFVIKKRAKHKAIYKNQEFQTENIEFIQKEIKSII